MHPQHPEGTRENTHARHTTRGTRAARLTGRLLCWSLAAAMLTTALDAIASSHLPAWWPIVWTTLWLSVPVTAAGWAVARHHEKRHQCLARHNRDQDVPCPDTDDYNTTA